MKKFILAVVLVFCMAGAAVADIPAKVVVNGKLLNSEAVMINDRVFVPLRAVGEALGAKVDWDGERAVVETVKEPETKELIIMGDDNFKSMIGQAIELLKEKDPYDYEMVMENAGLIASVPDNALTEGAYALGGNGMIAITPSLMNDSRKSTPAYIAGVLVHESSHNLDKKYGITDYYVTENMAYLREIAVLQMLRVPQQDIDSLEKTRQRVLNR